LSKLFDQLKKAARTREEKSPGLLLEALKATSEAGQARPPADVAPASAGAQSPIVASAQPVTPGAASPNPVTPGAALPQRPGAQSPYAGIIIAAAILGIVVLAWNAAPFRAPAKVKIDPSGLKLERSLDLKRPSSKGTSPPARPS
jgi:hypothetical protein